MPLLHFILTEGSLAAGSKAEKGTSVEEEPLKGVEDPEHQGPAPDFAGTAVLKMQAFVYIPCWV